MGEGYKEPRIYSYEIIKKKQKKYTKIVWI